MDLASQQRAAPHGRGVAGRGQVRGTGSLRKGLDGRGGAGAKSHRRGTWGHLQYSDCLPATHGAHLRRPTRRPKQSPAAQERTRRSGWGGCRRCFSGNFPKQNIFVSVLKALKSSEQSTAACGPRDGDFSAASGCPETRWARGMDAPEKVPNRTLPALSPGQSNTGQHAVLRPNAARPRPVNGSSLHNVCNTLQVSVKEQADSFGSWAPSPGADAGRVTRGGPKEGRGRGFAPGRRSGCSFGEAGKAVTGQRRGSPVARATVANREGPRNKDAEPADSIFRDSLGGLSPRSQRPLHLGCAPYEEAPHLRLVC